MTDKTVRQAHNADPMEQASPAVLGSVLSPVRPLAFVLACLLTACTGAGQAPADTRAPKDWRVFTTPGANYHYVFPVVMEDGTRCVAMAGNSSGGRSIACDWRK